MSYTEGDWKVVCSMCGFERRASEMVKNWQGMWRCPEHNEPRHSQEFVKGVPDDPAPPWTQPPPEDQFVPVDRDPGFPLECASFTNIADDAFADCAIAGAG